MSAGRTTERSRGGESRPVKTTRHRPVRTGTICRLTQMSFGTDSPTSARHAAQTLIRAWFHAIALSAGGVRRAEAPVLPTCCHRPSVGVLRGFGAARCHRKQRPTFSRTGQSQGMCSHSMDAILDRGRCLKRPALSRAVSQAPRRCSAWRTNRAYNPRGLDHSAAKPRQFISPQARLRSLSFILGRPG